MAVALTASIENVPEITSWLGRLDPIRNVKIMREGLKRCAYAVQKEAASNQIVAGGRGKRKALKVLKSKLTSRTGTLRRSIRVDFGGLPFSVDVGTDLKYGAVHEFGGEVAVPSRVVRAHQRKVAFGKKVKPFTVPAHFRSGHYKNFPKRAFMAPALKEVEHRFPQIFLDEWEKVARQ